MIFAVCSHEHEFHLPFRAQRFTPLDLTSTACSYLSNQIYEPPPAETSRARRELWLSRER